MELGDRIGWGVVIYAVVFLMGAALHVYDVISLPMVLLCELAALVVVCIWAGTQLKFPLWKDILPYSIGWAIICIALDAIFQVPLEGWGFYAQWTSWIVYALVALLPLLSTFLRRKPAPHGPWET